MTTILGIILIVMSVFLIIAVLMQHGKAHNLSGTIAGGAETFFGKSKGQTIDKKLSVLTTVIAIIFVCLVLAVYLLQDTADYSGNKSTYTGEDATEAVAGESTEAATTTKAAVTTVEVTTASGETETVAVTTGMTDAE